MARGARTGKEVAPLGAVSVAVTRHLLHPVPDTMLTDRRRHHHRLTAPGKPLLETAVKLFAMFVPDSRSNRLIRSLKLDTSIARPSLLAASRSENRQSLGLQACCTGVWITWSSGLLYRCGAISLQACCTSVWRLLVVMARQCPPPAAGHSGQSTGAASRPTWLCHWRRPSSAAGGRRAPHQPPPGSIASTDRR